MMDLTPAQQKIYDALTRGDDASIIMAEQNLSPSVFNAQCTRIINRGYTLPKSIKRRVKPQWENEAASEISDMVDPPSTRPRSDGPGQSEAILHQAAENPLDMDKVQALIEQGQRDGQIQGPMADIHPMAYMGIGIQFMRVCGGRVRAHQVLEDVYGAVCQMVQERGGDPHQHADACVSRPSPKSTTDKLDNIINMLTEMKKDAS